MQDGQDESIRLLILRILRQRPTALNRQVRQVRQVRRTTKMESRRSETTELAMVHIPFFRRQQPEPRFPPLTYLAILAYLAVKCLSPPPSRARPSLEARSVTA